MKKVLALMGSPRKNKNTDKLLDYLLAGIGELNYEIKKVYLKDIDVHPCTGCDHCGRTGGCVFDDGMSEIYEGFDNSDIVILAAPLYFNSINGLSKNIIDRCQKYWSIKYTLGESYKRNEDRRGMFICVGGAPYTHKHFEGALPIMDLFFKSINVQYLGNYFVSNTDRLNLDDCSKIKEELYQIGKDFDRIENFYLHR